MCCNAIASKATALYDTLLLTRLDRKTPEVTTLDVIQAWRTSAFPVFPSRVSLWSAHAPGFAREVWYYGCFSCLKAESQFQATEANLTKGEIFLFLATLWHVSVKMPNYWNNEYSQGASAVAVQLMRGANANIHFTHMHVSLVMLHDALQINRHTKITS